MQNLYNNSKHLRWHNGIEVSRNIFYRAIKDGDLLHKVKRPHGITKSTTKIQEQENIIKRNLKSNNPVQRLLTDITEIQCADGNLYVSPDYGLLQWRDTCH